MVGKFGKFGLKALFVSCAFIVRVAEALDHESTNEDFRGCSREINQCSLRKSTSSYLAKIKALEENITSLQLGLFQQCATPCYSANNSVYGKEGMKGEKGEKGGKGEKGDPGTNCKHNSQDPNKPSAHIEGANHKTGVSYQGNTVIKDWNVNAPSSHLAGGMKYYDGNLTVPTPGRYYIYTQIYYHSTGRVVVFVNSNPVTMIQPLGQGTGHGGLYAGGVFKLNSGDVISLKTRTQITIYMSSTFHSYFGAFLI